MGAPLFSVIVATHRRAPLLARALESLRAQTFQDFEIVLCADEGSPDTKTVAAQGLREQDVFICRPGARGPAESRNLGLGLARGRYVAFLDDDDTFKPDYLAAVARRLGQKPAEVLYTNFTVITEQRPTGQAPLITRVQDMRTIGNPLKSLWVSNFIPNNCTIIERNLAASQPIDIHLESHEDWDYLLGLLAVARFEHLDVFGPCVHTAEDPDGHRNAAPVQLRTKGLDYLSIYRKRPAPDDETRAGRLGALQVYRVEIGPQAM